MTTPKYFCHCQGAAWGWACARQHRRLCVCVCVCVRFVRGTTWVNAWTRVRTPLGLGEVVFAAATRVCAVASAVGRLLWTCMLVCAIAIAFSPPFQGMLALCPCVFARACKYIAMSLLFVLLALCVHSVLMSHLLSSAVLACFSADGTVSVAAM